MKTIESQATEFKMKAECESDLRQIKSMLQPWVRYWDVVHLTLEHQAQHFVLPDVEVEFGLSSGAPTLGQIRGLLYGIADCHVAEETVALARDYTGERVPLEETDSLPELPSAECMKLIRASMARCRDYLRIEQRRAELAIRMLSEAAITGEHTPRDRAGFIALVEHKESGMMSIRRISATKKDEMGGGEPIKERMVLLQN